MSMCIYEIQHPSWILSEQVRRLILSKSGIGANSSTSWAGLRFTVRLSPHQNDVSASSAQVSASISLSWYHWSLKAWWNSTSPSAVPGTGPSGITLEESKLRYTWASILWNIARSSWTGCVAALFIKLGYSHMLLSKPTCINSSYKRCNTSQQSVSN